MQAAVLPAAGDAGVGDVQPRGGAQEADDISVLDIVLYLRYFLRRDGKICCGGVQPFLGPADKLQGPVVLPQPGIIVPVGGHEGEFLMKGCSVEFRRDLPQEAIVLSLQEPFGGVVQAGGVAGRDAVLTSRRKPLS